MKSNDIIRPFGTSLFVHFGTTGQVRNISTIRIDQGITFSLNGNAIEGRYHDKQNDFVLELFSSDSLASTALHELKVALARYARFRRISSLAKGFIKWGIAPILLCALALAMNMAATRAGDNNGKFAQLPIVAPALAQVPAPLPSPTAAAAAAATQQIAATSAQLSRAMDDGVKTGKYTVQLSKGARGTLYVFSDPLCSHCQEFEPELEKLAKEYTIYVFPVSVIGGEASMRGAAKVLCGKSEARASLWRKSVAGEELPGGSCADGAAAVAANNQFFRVMRFAGTPTVINGAGEQTPETVLNTSAAIDQWLASAANSRN